MSCPMSPEYTMQHRAIRHVRLPNEFGKENARLPILRGS